MGLVDQLIKENEDKLDRIRELENQVNKMRKFLNKNHYCYEPDSDTWSSNSTCNVVNRIDKSIQTEEANLLPVNPKSNLRKPDDTIEISSDEEEVARAPSTRLRPLKRRRIIERTTNRQLSVDSASVSSEEAYSSLDEDQEALALITRHAVHVPALEIKSNPTCPPVKRKFLKDTFANGGNMYTLVLDTKLPVKNTDRNRVLVFPQQDMNPGLPTQPGKPGTMLCSKEEVLGEPKIKSLFTKPNDSETNWQYLGEYIFLPAGRFSSKTFTAQNEVLRTGWASFILGNMGYANIRARVSLRSQGKELTEENIEEEKKAFRSIKSGNIFPHESAARIEQALACGEEYVHIVKLQCVDYDHAFASEIISKYPNYIASEKRRGNAGSKRRRS